MCTFAVAPPVGAWIEIRVATLYGMALKSLPLWERGLKYIGLKKGGVGRLSLPLWERGLKYDIIKNRQNVIESLPLWERGLK